jgi:hypothetical protein
MKNIKVNKGFIATAFIIALFVFKSMADTPQEGYYILGGGAYNYMVSVGPGNYINNPNMYATVMLKCVINGVWKNWGFLLDGSELSKAWLKMLQDAAATNKKLEIYVDDNTNNGYGQHLTNSSFIMGKLVYVGIYSYQ